MSTQRKKNTLRKTTSANPGLPSSLPSLPALRQEISAARRALEAMEPKVLFERDIFACWGNGCFQI